MLSFSLGAYKIDCFMLCTGLCWDSFHNLVWVFGDRVDAEISSFMPQPLALVSFNVQKTVNTCVVKLKYWGGMPGVS